MSIKQLIDDRDKADNLLDEKITKFIKIFDLFGGFKETDASGCGEIVAQLSSISCNDDFVVIPFIEYYSKGDPDGFHVKFPFDLIDNPTEASIKNWIQEQERDRIQKKAKEDALKSENIKKHDLELIEKLKSKYPEKFA